MSQFDKLVAQWVDKSGASIATDTRKHILTNISSNLDTYKQLENPDAVKQKEQEAARKKKAEEKKAEREEARRREEERSSNLPPLGAPRKPKAKRSARKISTAKGKGTAPAATSGRIKVDVKNVDFGFKADVTKSIEQLEEEKRRREERAAAPQSAAAPPPVEVPAAAEAAAPTPNNSVAVEGSTTIDPALKSSTATNAHRDAAASSSAHPKPPPMTADFAPTDDALANALQGEKDVDFDIKSSPRSPVPEVVQQREQHEEVSELVQSESMQYEEHHMNAFTFGAPTQPGEVDEEEHSDDVDVDDDEDERQPEVAPLDDKEDRRRRTLQLKRGTRAGISDVPIDADEAIHANIATTPKSRDNMKVIERTLERHFLFSFLDDEDIAKIASAMDLRHFEDGEAIVEKGEVDDEFFLILSGHAVTHAAIESGEQETVPLGRGDTVGDIALMYASPSEFTVTATEAVECASLNRHTYKIITSRAMDERRQRYAALLDHVPYLSCLTAEERSSLAETLKEGTFSKGEKLICAGAPGNWIHIVVEGTLDVVGSGSSNVITTLHEGDCAGHIEFLYGHVSVANVVVSSETAKTARLGKRMFDRLIGTAREVMVKEIEEGQSYEEYRQTMRSEARPQEDTNPAFDEPPLYLQSTLRQQQCSMRLQEEESSLNREL